VRDFRLFSGGGLVCLLAPSAAITSCFLASGWECFQASCQPCTQVLPLFVWDAEGSKAKMFQLCVHVACKHNLPVPDASWLCPLSWPFFTPGAFWGLGAGDRVAALGSFPADFSSLLLPDSF